MVARMQQGIALALFAFVAGWAIVMFASGHAAWAPVGGIALAVGYALFMAIEFWLLHRVSRDSSAPRARYRQYLAAWWGEVMTGPRVFCWAQPFRTYAVPDWQKPLPGDSNQPRRGVVLVHGFLCNRALWNPWMRRLQRRGIPFVAVTMEPAFGSIDNYVAPIEAAVRRLEADTGLPPVIVAHSMGGLAVRKWLVRNRSGHRVCRVITIGTPHRGTWLGRFAFSINGGEMHVGSAWLQALTAAESADFPARFTCYYGHCDNIVFPPETATLHGADNRHLPGIAHLSMVFHPTVFAETLQWLDAAALSEPA